MNRQILYAAIEQERKRQDCIHGPSASRPVPSTAVLVEEVGEVAKAILENDEAGLKDELIQVAAVAVAMVEGLHRGDWPA